MAADPIFILFDVAAALLIVWWLYKIFAPTHHVYRQRRWRAAIIGALASSVAAIVFVLRNWASSDVVDDPYYVVGYLSLGVVWISVSAGLLAKFADIRFQQDVRDRNNFAAAVAIGGLLVGSAIAYAGGNIGDGPGFHVVIFSALLSTFTVYAAVWVLALASEGEERITVDHDVGAAIRVSAVAIGVGIIAGRAAAGDWVGMEETVRDFAWVAWPAGLLVIGAVANERATPPSYSAASTVRSVLFAILVVAGAAIYVIEHGAW